MERQDIEVYRYNLDARISMSGGYLEYVRRRANREGRKIVFAAADVLYHAAQDLLARALRVEADWVLVVSGMYMHPDWMILMERAGIKVSVLLTESPYDDRAQVSFVRHCKIAWTNERSSVPFLRQFNPNIGYLPHAYDPEVHNPTPKPDQVVGFGGHDVIFVGTGFIERQRILEAVDWTGIDLGLYGTYPLLGSRSRLRKYVKGGYVDNAVVAEMYRRSKIGLNLYRTSMGFGRNADHIGHAESMNPRQLELAACGVFTISSFRQEIKDVFGAKGVTFSSADDLEPMIRHYLDHSEERDRIARVLPTLVQDYTFDDMAGTLLYDLRQLS